MAGRKGQLVPDLMTQYLSKGYRIEVEILKRVNYKDTSFSRAAHRLALAELRIIVKYQKTGQCLEQKPEGVGEAELNYWEQNYKKN